MDASSELVVSSDVGRQRLSRRTTSVNDQFTQDLRAALQLALQHQKESVFNALLDLSGITLESSISMIGLYLQQDKATMLTKHKGLKRKLRRIARKSCPTSEPLDLQESFLLYQTAVVKPFEAVSRVLSRLLAEGSGTRAHDVTTQANLNLYNAKTI